MTNQILRIEDTMVDSDVSSFFELATKRKYNQKETCVNDIRRMLMLFWNQHLCKIAPKEKLTMRDLRRQKIGMSKIKYEIVKLTWGKVSWDVCLLGNRKPICNCVVKSNAIKICKALNAFEVISTK